MTDRIKKCLNNQKSLAEQAIYYRDRSAHNYNIIIQYYKFLTKLAKRFPELNDEIEAFLVSMPNDNFLKILAQDES